MTRNSQTLRFLRQRIPAFECQPGCHDCCGPVLASSEEMARLPRPGAAQRALALSELSCPHLGEKGCQVYLERPLICRLFGTTPRLPCPVGKRPARMIDEEVEEQIHRFMAETRQVLV